MIFRLHIAASSTALPDVRQELIPRFKKKTGLAGLKLFQQYHNFLTWLLPYLQYQPLYKRLHQALPWFR